MTNNNNISKDVPPSTASYPANPVRPTAYAPLQPPHTNPVPSGMHSGPAPPNEAPAPPRYTTTPAANSQTMSAQYNYAMQPQHTLGVGPPASQGLPPIHGSLPSTTSGAFPRFSGNGGALAQYATGEAQPMSAMAPDQDHAKISMPSAAPAGGPGQNGTLSGQSMMQMLGAGSGFPKGPSVPGLEGNIIMPTQDQMLIQGPIVLNQLNSVAEFLAAKGDFTNAIKYYERITGLDPENGAAWTALGHCYLLTDDLQKAFTSYQKALYSLPDVRDPQLWYGIGLLYDKVRTTERLCSSKHMSTQYQR